MGRYLIVLGAALVLLLSLTAISFADGVLNYWCYWDEGHPNDMFMRQIVADFEKETGVKVNYSNPGRDVLLKIRPTLVQGNPPDLFDGHGIEMWPALIRDDLLVNLEDLYKGPGYGPDNDTTFEDLFIEGIDEQWAKEGVRVYVPYCNNTSVIWYNKAMFDELNLTPPSTFAGLADICASLQVEGIEPFAQDGGIFYDAYFFYWLSIRINGAGAMTEAALDPTGEKWDTPGFLKTAELSARFSENNWLMEGAEANIWPAGQMQFVQGNGAMILVGSWLVNETYDKTAPDFQYGAFPFPAVEGGKGDPGSVEMESIGWAIPRGAEDPGLAKQFIRFAMQEKYQKRLFDAFYPPSRKGLVDKAPAELRDVMMIMQNATSTHKMFDGLQASGDYWANVFLPLEQDLLYGRLSPEGFIAEIKQKTIEFHKK